MVSMKEEMNSLYDNKAWKLIDKPTGSRVEAVSGFLRENRAFLEKKRQGSKLDWWKKAYTKEGKRLQ